MIRATIGIFSQGGVAIDADAQAFFDRVDTAGGTLSATEQVAVNRLVLDMKDYGIWSSMKAIYPMVGASASACAQNLKSSSFTGTFIGAWTFASTGVTGNGTNTSFNTTINPSIDLSLNDVHISFYSRTDNDQNGVDIGTDKLTIQFYGGSLYYRINSSSYASLGAYASNKFALGSRLSSSQQKLYLNDTLEDTTNSSTAPLDNKDLRLGSWDDDDFPTDREYAFASIGDGLTDSEASDFYDAVQAFNTRLSREV